MTDTITQMQAEDAIASTNQFLANEYNSNMALDGGYAASNVEQRVLTKAEAALDTLTSTPIPEYPDFYLAVGRLTLDENVYQGGDYNQAVAALPGHFVLVPAKTKEGLSFFPAVVSEDGLKTNELRLHVLMQPYRQRLGYGANTALSGAGQAETKGVGDCSSRKGRVGFEAEHFKTIARLAADSVIESAAKPKTGTDQSSLTEDWQNGKHINHTWRADKQNSVVAEFTGKLLKDDMPQRTMTFTRQDIESGRKALLWHRVGMTDQRTGRPEVAVKENALLTVQALGFETLRDMHPQGVDTAIKLMATKG